MNIIFVCTGNTCRSPMAEYYLKSKNLKNVSVISRGFSGDDTANENAVLVMKEAGIDISAHISKAITKNDLENADAVICMTESHKQAILAAGIVCDTLYVLDGGISDPFGQSLDIYRSCRDSIFFAIDRLIADGFFSKTMVTPAKSSDVSSIAEIEKATFSTPWSENAIKESMDSGTCFYVARTSGLIVGYMGISKICGEGYVTNIAVLPEYRRMGIGEKILRHVIDSSKDGLEFISLEVRASNTAAIALYEKLGFQNVGLRKKFYTNPVEDAIIMTKNFL